MWILCAFGSAFFAGVTAILAKCGIKNVHSNLATAVRTVVVLLFAWVMVFVVGVQGEISTISGSAVLYLVLSGLSTGASWLCYFRALQVGDVNKVTPIDKSSTVITMLLALLIFHEGFGVVSGIAIVLIGVGTYFMIQPKHQSADDSQPSNKSRTWILYAFGSAIFASLTVILGKMGIAEVDSTLGTAIRTIVVLIMAWVVVFVGRQQYEISTIDKRSWLFLVLSGLATGASWLCYYYALQIGLVSVVVPIDKLSIVVTVVFSYFVFREKLTRIATLGLIMIIVGTLLMIL